jgi:uncharacterized membrane protein
LTADRALRALLGLVALAGTALSAYLTYVHYEPKALICTGSGGCEKVQDSDYAVTAGVPVAVLGLALWLLVAALTLWDAPITRVVTVALGLASLAFASYLVILQLFVIDAICVWCIVNDLVLVPLLAGISLVRLIRD